MGIFKTTHKVTEEEKTFQLENLERLKNEFDVTKAMGVKKWFFTDFSGLINQQSKKHLITAHITCD